MRSLYTATNVSEARDVLHFKDPHVSAQCSLWPKSLHESDSCRSSMHEGAEPLAIYGCLSLLLHRHGTSANGTSAGRDNRWQGHRHSVVRYAVVLDCTVSKAPPTCTCQAYACQACHDLRGGETRITPSPLTNKYGTIRLLVCMNLHTCHWRGNNLTAHIGHMSYHRHALTISSYVSSSISIEVIVSSTSPNIMFRC